MLQSTRLHESLNNIHCHIWFEVHVKSVTASRNGKSTTMTLKDLIATLTMTRKTF